MTIRHLLNHTSGIPDYTDSTVDLHREYSEDQLVRLAAGLPLAFAPGENWSYSNTGYLLLGALIHRATGSFYGDLLAKWLFRPLGMPSARIISEADIVPNRAAGYQMAQGKLANQDWVSPSLNTTADGSLYLSLRTTSAGRWPSIIGGCRAVRCSTWRGRPRGSTAGGSIPTGPAGYCCRSARSPTSGIPAPGRVSRPASSAICSSI